MWKARLVQTPYEDQFEYFVFGREKTTRPVSPYSTLLYKKYLSRNIHIDQYGYSIFFTEKQHDGSYRIQNYHWKVTYDSVQHINHAKFGDYDIVYHWKVTRKIIPKNRVKSSLWNHTQYKSIRTSIQVLSFWNLSKLLSEE